MWFPDHSYADYEFKLPYAGLCDRVYEMIKG